MTHYLLSVHSVEGEARDPMTEEEMRHFMERVGVLEEDMKSAGAWVFGGALHDPDTSTVARVSDSEVLTTDGPFAESDVDAARKVDEAEVGRIFREESGRSVAALIRRTRSRSPCASGPATAYRPTRAPGSRRPPATAPPNAKPKARKRGRCEVVAGRLLFPRWSAIDTRRPAFPAHQLDHKPPQLKKSSRFRSHTRLRIKVANFAAGI